MLTLHFASLLDVLVLQCGLQKYIFQVVSFRIERTRSLSRLSKVWNWFRFVIYILEQKNYAGVFLTRVFLLKQPNDPDNDVLKSPRLTCKFVCALFSSLSSIHLNEWTWKFHICKFLDLSLKKVGGGYSPPSPMAARSLGSVQHHSYEVHASSLILQCLYNIEKFEAAISWTRKQSYLRMAVMW